MELVLAPNHRIELGSNILVGVPIILQYDDTPLIDCINDLAVGSKMRFTIFANDGVKLAVVKGSRIFPTADGEDAGIALRHPDQMCVCELNGQTLFEVRRQGPAAWKLDAELYTSDGSFVQCHEQVGGLINSMSGEALEINGTVWSGNVISGDIGFLVGSDGSVSCGVSLGDDRVETKEIASVDTAGPPLIEVRPLKMTPRWKHDIKDLIERGD